MNDARPFFEKTREPQSFAPYFHSLRVHPCNACNQEVMDQELFEPSFYVSLESLRAHTKNLFRLHCHTKTPKEHGRRALYARPWWVIESLYQMSDGFWRPAMVAGGYSLSEAIKAAIAEIPEIP